jgi:hypothetical protein
MLHRLRINYGHRSINRGDLSFLLGSQVPCEFDFHTTEASIVIPPMSKCGLCCFVFCIILSEGININYGDILCTIYEHNKHVDECDVFYVRGRLISDHVLLSCWYDIYKLVEVGSARGGDHYNLSFEFKFKHYVDDKVQWSTKGIMGCGVFPMYGLEHSKGVESSAQFSDDDSDQH